MSSIDPSNLRISSLKVLSATQSDCMAVVSASAPCQSQRFQQALDYASNLGIKIKVFGDPCAEYGTAKYLFSSAPALERAKNLMAAFLDPEVAVVLSARGAYGTAETLMCLDEIDGWRQIAEAGPKPFVGFSDSTVLLVALNQRSSIPTVHGPSFESAFSKAANEPLAAQSVAGLVSLLRSGQLPAIKLTQIFGPAESRKGAIIGGNLSVLTSLMGTDYQINAKNRFVFLEEIAEKPYKIHRMLLQLKLAGQFRGCLGVLLGQFSGCNHPQGLPPTIEQVFADIFQDLGLPVWSGVPSGHDLFNSPLPFGVQMKIEGDILSA